MQVRIDIPVSGVRCPRHTSEQSPFNVPRVVGGQIHVVDPFLLATSAVLVRPRTQNGLRPLALAETAVPLVLNQRLKPESTDAM